MSNEFLIAVSDTDKVIFSAQYKKLSIIHVVVFHIILTMLQCPKCVIKLS